MEVNTIGSPSAIVLKNTKKILFDKNLWMRLDVDYYFSLFKKLGKPLYIRNVFIVNEIHKKQFSSLMLNKDKTTKIKLKEELEYLRYKHNYKKEFLKFIFLRLFIKLDRLILSFLYEIFRKYFDNVNEIFINLNMKNILIKNFFQIIL